jgi:hypothetical protein
MQTAKTILADFAMVLARFLLQVLKLARLNKLKIFGERSFDFTQKTFAALPSPPLLSVQLSCM